MVYPLIPGVGAGYYWANAVTGQDAFTNQKLSGGDRFTSVISGFGNVLFTSEALYAAQGYANYYQASQNDQAEESTLNRPYLRQSTVESIQNNATTNSQGQYIDFNTRQPIQGKYDIGHIEGQEFSRMSNWAQNQGMSQSQFNDYANNPNLYQIEDPSSNRSHLYEDTSPIENYTPMYNSK